VLAEFRGVARPGLPIQLFGWMKRMTPKYHPTPLSGGDRKALKKELGKAARIPKKGRTGGCSGEPTARCG
jgi:hypothetical protein